MKRKLLIPVLIVLALVLGYGGFYLYRSYHPNMMLLRSRPAGGAADHYREGMTIVTFGSSIPLLDIPVAAPVRAEMDRLWAWYDGVENDLIYNYQAPMHITVSGEVEDGKTTLRYQGYATNQAGERVEYLEEETFNYVFVPQDELLQ